MPLPPLPDPQSPAKRAAALARAIPTSAFLFSTLMGFNMAQTASMAVRPVSKKTFRRFNRWAADTWWGMCVDAGELLYDVKLLVTGDDVPMRENAIVVANHQQMTDITCMMAYAKTKDRLGDLKFFVKDPVKYVPGVGWGMWFLDCPFLKRDWAKDRASIEQTFSAFLRENIPMWLVSFPEGTRLTEEKLAKSRQYAESQGLAALQHVLLPRTKGFVASVQGLRTHVKAVYDLTLGYERGLPSLWQYIKGYARRFHLHVRRYAIDSLPEGEAELATWLIDRYREKDALLEAFYRDGKFATT
ncbi:MAG: acyltransferase [Deltaproteobacteria bacterium]|nr:acyltransferase [Deltaproteobacteria bacterium]